MKTYLKIGAVILAVLLVFIFVIKSGIEMNYNNELEKINFGKLFDEFNKENALYEELKEYQYLKI